MRTTILLSLTCGISLLSNAVCAQENKSIDQKDVSGKSTISVFVAGGLSPASAKMKDSLFAGNGWNLTGGVYLPLLSRSNPGNTTGHFSAGIEAVVSYTQQKADGGKPVYTSAYHLQDGTIAPAFSGGTPHAHAFKLLAGPKAEWLFGRIVVSPAMLFGYMSMKRNAYTLSGTVANPKQPAESKYIPFITSAGYTTSGFAWQPKIEAGYHITSHLSLFATGALSFGPSIENTVAYWKPVGGAGAGNAYSYDQFANGAAKTAVFASRWQSATVGMGLRYTWINSSFDKGHGGRKNGRTASKAIGSARKSGGAVSSSYAAGRVAQPADSTKMPGRLSMTPTTAKQTQGISFGEKVAGGMQSGGSAANLVAGNPVPGVVVKGGKNPPVKMITGTSNNNGEVILNGLEAGNYLFTLTAPGQSVGGIAVKGGKIPGTSFTALTVNGNGQIGFEVLEGGDYKFIIEASDPHQPSSDKAKKASGKVVEKATSGLKDTLKTQV